MTIRNYFLRNSFLGMSILGLLLTLVGLTLTRRDVKTYGFPTTIYGYHMEMLTDIPPDATVQLVRLSDDDDPYTLAVLVRVPGTTTAEVRFFNPAPIPFEGPGGPPPIPKSFVKPGPVDACGLHNLVASKAGGCVPLNHPDAVKR